MNKLNKVMTPAQETSVNIVRLVLDFIVRIVALCKKRKANDDGNDGQSPNDNDGQSPSAE